MENGTVKLAGKAKTKNVVRGRFSPSFVLGLLFILLALTYYEGMSRKSKKQQRDKYVFEQRKQFSFEDSYDVVVIGGGASGLACALSLVQEAKRLGISRPRIMVLEKGKKLGASILRSGNGRCNFSNAHLDISQFHNAGFVACVSRTLEECFNLGRYSEEQSETALNSVLQWFESLGLVWREQPGSGGLLYPYSNKASSVLEVLLSELNKEQIDFHTSTRVAVIRSCGEGYEIDVDEVLAASHQGKGTSAQAVRCCAPRKARIKTARVVLAAGGGFGKDLLQYCAPEIPFIFWEPILGPLRAVFPKGVSAESLDGIRAQARIVVPSRNYSEEGEVLFREYGISGIVVFNASRFVLPGDEILLDLVPDSTQSELEKMLTRRQKKVSTSKELFFEGFLLPELAQAIFCAAGVDRAESAGDITKLAQTLKSFSLRVEGIADERQCQVKRGGVSPEAVSSKTLEVKDMRGLYILGEALDVDGPCGGYNLHWAWTSGMLSGKALAHEMADSK